MRPSLKLQLSALLLTVTTVIAAGGCTKKPALIEVGKHRIDHETLEKRTSQVRLLRPETTRGQAAAGVIEGLVAASVLASRDAAIDRDALVGQRVTLEKNPDIAKLYREVEKIYAGDTEAFLAVGLLPDMAIRRLHDIFDDEDTEEKKAREDAAAVLVKAQDQPERFASMATEAQAFVHVITVTKEGIVRNQHGTPIQILSADLAADHEAGKRLTSIAANTAPNKVLGMVLRGRQGHLLLKRLHEQEGSIAFEAALFRRSSFGEWLKEQAAELTVCINDDTLRFEYAQAGLVNLLNCPK